MARPERFELPTNWFEASYSIQLSYGRRLSSIQRLQGSRPGRLRLFRLRRIGRVVAAAEPSLLPLAVNASDTACAPAVGRQAALVRATRFA